MTDAARYPDLNDFLSTEWIQDPNDDRPIDERVREFATHRDPAAPARVSADVRRFLHDQHNDLDDAFDTIFDPQVYPPGYGMTTALFLEHIAGLMDDFRPE